MTAYDASTYIVCPALQQSFLNKDDGSLLAGGYIFFYSDTTRNTLQNIYYLTGSASDVGGYTVTALPNPLILSSIGTIVDADGAPVLVLLYPYDPLGNVSNYYVSVYSGNPLDDGVFQFDLENVPGIGESSGPSGVSGANNYVVNGQFFLHNNIPNDVDNNGTGYISQASTAIAPGGHYFQVGGTINPAQCKQYVNFVLINETGDNGIPGYPRYWAQFSQEGTIFNTTNPRYSFRFPNVNLFAGSTITFGFVGESQSGLVTCPVSCYQFYGTGGSSSIPSVIGSAQISGSPGKFSFPFEVPTNETGTLGPNQDDYIEFVITFPTTSSYNLSITDVFIVDGSFTNALYPITSPQQMYYGGLAGGYALSAKDQSSGISGYDGYDLYLPIINLPTGFGADYSVVGQLSYFFIEPNWAEVPYLKVDGASYQYGLYSPLGVPYARLGNMLWDDTAGSFIFGTGYEFAQSFTPSSDNNILLYNNSFGLVTPSNANTSTFTVQEVHAAIATSYGVRCYQNQGQVGTSDSDQFYIENIKVGVVEDPVNSPSNSGFTIAMINSTQVYPSGYGPSLPPTTTPVPVATIYEAPRMICLMTAVAGSALASPSAAGKYFTFESINDAGAATGWCVWFKITNETQPAPGGIYTNFIQVNVLSSDTPTSIAYKTISSLRATEVSLISCVAASSIPSLGYWSFDTTGGNYYVWYQVNGTGTDPEPSGFVGGIMVSILSTDTSAQVASKTVAAINKFKFGTPDARGMFFRAEDTSRVGQVDLDILLRYNQNVIGIPMGNVGTAQYDQIIQHIHNAYNDYLPGQTFSAYTTPIRSPSAGAKLAPTGADADSGTFIPGGGSESRPYNLYVQVGIRY